MKKGKEPDLKHMGQAVNETFEQSLSHDEMQTYLLIQIYRSLNLLRDELWTFKRDIAGVKKEISNLKTNAS